MKKSLLVGICLLVVLLCFVSCVDKPAATQLTGLTLPQLQSDQMAVVVKDADGGYATYTVTLNSDIKTCEDVVRYLSENSSLEVEWFDSGYGKFIGSIGGAKPQGNQWITVMTDLEEFQDKAGAYAVTYLVGDVTLVTANAGVSDIAAKGGSVLYFEVVG